jgi:glycosyltransferase involved in cell wall biosynthesis
MPADVTVAVPVLNGARYLDEVLAAVRAQRVDREVEILVVDSGSTDGSLAIAERHGARIHRISRSEFSHGGTRNLMMELAHGAHVAFLTQDATPAHDRWLAALLEGFEQADDVALVFGPHTPRPGASHMIRVEMERHFGVWGDGGRAIAVQRLGRSGPELAAYRDFPGRFTFFSDVNGCVARWAWEEIPYRSVPYAEDQLLGREIIEAGFAKVFHPEARVIHSHDYPPLRFLRRYFDEFRSLREVLDHVEPAHPLRTPRSIRALARNDARWLRERGVGGAALARAVGPSYRHHAIRQAGAIAGTRADRLPRLVRRVLSLDGRDTFTPSDVPQSPLLPPAQTQPDSRPVERHGRWEWAYIPDYFPPRPLTTEAHSGDATGPWTIAWVVPPWRRGSGGHTTVFRLVRQMELRGHRCVIYVHDPSKVVRRSGGEMREEIREHFVPGVEAEVFKGLQDFDSADVCIATAWQTAWPVRDLTRCREKVYLVQDHEPEFYATSSQSVWAEETYRLGYRCIAYTPWMADVLRARYGVEARWFECGTDLDVFSFAGPQGRESEIVAVYARRETERRALDLAIAAL